MTESACAILMVNSHGDVECDGTLNGLATVSGWSTST